MPPIPSLRPQHDPEHVPWSCRWGCQPLQGGATRDLIPPLAQRVAPDWSKPISKPVLLSVQFSLVAQSCLTLCDPMNHRTPGLPVHHQLSEFTQTHVHRVSDAIQPSHPLSSPSPPAPIPPSIRVFSNESTLRMRWPEYWSFSFSIIPSKEHPGLISFRMD